MKAIKISLVGTPHDYQHGIVPLIIRGLGYKIKWLKSDQCDLQICGPFIQSNKKRFGWMPKPVRPLAFSIESSLKNTLNLRSSTPLRLFHTAENIRHDSVVADYSLSYDLSVQSNRHFRMPYWMEMIDWSHEGLAGNQNPRFGQLISISKLMQPLGSDFLTRPQRVAFFSSHLREPRATLVKVVENLIPLEGFGPYYDRRILDHHQSGIRKLDILQNFAFNLCPENGLYPGYYSEKVPEAFAAGCLPITWTDTNVCVDFNPEAFINLEPMSWEDFEQLKTILSSHKRLEAYSEQPLLLHEPSIEPLKSFVREVVKQALS